MKIKLYFEDRSNKKNFFHLENNDEGVALTLKVQGKYFNSFYSMVALLDIYRVIKSNFSFQHFSKIYKTKKTAFTKTWQMPFQLHFSKDFSFLSFQTSLFGLDSCIHEDMQKNSRLGKIPSFPSNQDSITNKHLTKTFLKLISV